MKYKLKEGILIGVIFATIIIVGYLQNKSKFDELSEFGKTTEAKIISYKYRSNGRFLITYRYEVDGKIYKKSEAVSSFTCNEPKNKNKGCVGMLFKLTYSSENPNINEIDLGKYNFNKGIKPH